VSAKAVLFLCYGNPGRMDDSLGAAFARELEGRSLSGVTIEADYQLAVEDAPTISEHDTVIFVDASVNGPEPFSFQRLTATRGMSFTSHSVQPDRLLGLAEELFGSRASAYVLGIRGYRFNDFGESLSSGAQRNLAAALEFMTGLLEERSFDQAARVFGDSPQPC
jgi:hydrogenase maturation protease